MKVNIVLAFSRRSEVKDEKGLKSRAEVSTFLLEREANAV